MYQMYIVEDKNNPVLFPVTPGKLSLKINNQNKTLTLINEGEVNLIKHAGLTDIQIDSLLLPLFQYYPFAQYDNGFQGAKYYLDKLEKWKLSRKPVQFKLIRTGAKVVSGETFQRLGFPLAQIASMLELKEAVPDRSRLDAKRRENEEKPKEQPAPSYDKALLFDTTFSVTIEDYEIIEDAAGNGQDIEVKLNMKQYVPWGAKKLVIKDKPKVVAIRASKEPAKSYTVKSGDTLYTIAKKQLNNASKWKSIYMLNKSVIESAAKKHGRKSSGTGHWIYPGTKLKLPAK